MRRYIPHKAENWSIDHGYDKCAGIETYPRRALLSGSLNALTVNMNVDIDDLDYACTSFQGFQVMFIIHCSKQLRKISKNGNEIKFFKITCQYMYTNYNNSK